MPQPVDCHVCDTHRTVRCRKCKGQGYLLRNEGETIGSGDDIVICAQCKGAGSEPCPTCSHTSLPDA